MKYWPGTKIRKSTGNAFDWQNTASNITKTKEFKMSQASSIQMAGKGAEKGKSFTIYSKARPS